MCKTVFIYYTLCGLVLKWKFYCRFQFTKFTSMTGRNNKNINLLQRIPYKVPISSIIRPKTRNIEICLETSSNSSSIAPLRSEEDHHMIDQFAGIKYDYGYEFEYRKKTKKWMW